MYAVRASLLDIPLDGIEIKNVNPASVPARQRRQIEFTRSGGTYTSVELREKIDALGAPLHFVDFETSRLALPYHRGMRPYGLVAFQWSCHSVHSIGQQPVHRDSLGIVSRPPACPRPLEVRTSWRPGLDCSSL